MGGLVSRRFCVHCGRELNSGSHFCTGCGQPAGEPQPPAPEPPAAEPDLTSAPDTTVPPGWPQSPAPAAPTWQENTGAWFRPEDSPAQRFPLQDMPPPGHSGAPGRPPGDSGGTGRRSSSRWPVVLGIVLIVALGGTAAAVISMRAKNPPAPTPASTVSPTAQPTPTTASPSPPPPPTQQQAAQNLSALLSLSVADRGSIVAAAQNVGACGSGLAHDATTFASAAKSREDLLSRLAGLSGRSTLSASMISDLAKAWRASQQADQDLAAWAKDESQGCSTNSQHDPNFQAAVGPDGRATHFKKAFVEQWNPIAARYSLPSYKWDQL